MKLWELRELVQTTRDMDESSLVIAMGPGGQHDAFKVVGAEISSVHTKGKCVILRVVEDR